MNPPIPPFAETDWERVRAIPIADPAPALYLLPSAPYWHIRPVYAELGIHGAITTCYLRAEVIFRLKQAAENIAAHGYQLHILDGWRPPAVQQALYDDIYHELRTRHPEDSDAERHIRTQHFVSLPSTNPKRPSPHFTGGSVDVVLSQNGILLDMGSHFDEPSRRSYTDAYEHTDNDIRTRRRILYHAMIRAGFTNLPSEWWHYDYGNQNWAHYSNHPVAYYGLVYPSARVGTP